jgi:hypothetical protein
MDSRPPRCPGLPRRVLPALAAAIAMPAVARAQTTFPSR